MELLQIEICLESSNPQDRMRGITALRGYEPEVAVPLLLRRVTDSEIIIRSFVAMGLGRKQTPDGFTALIEILQSDRDPNVRAEAANSLAMFGAAAVPLLIEAFRVNHEWVVRLSILPVLASLDCPAQLLQVCQLALADHDVTVRDTALEQLMGLAATPYQEAALEILLAQVQADRWQTRSLVALVLQRFGDLRAQAAVVELRRDSDYRVVAATLEALLP